MLHCGIERARMLPCPKYGFVALDQKKFTGLGQILQMPTQRK
jgi:hypothetical protein